jgi:hypothetical protein
MTTSRAAGVGMSRRDVSAGVKEFILRWYLQVSSRIASGLQSAARANPSQKETPAAVAGAPFEYQFFWIRSASIEFFSRSQNLSASYKRDAEMQAGV